MKLMGKIGIIILLLITAVIFGGCNNVVHEKGTNSTISVLQNQTEIITNSLGNVEDDDESDEDEAVYVCGDDDKDKKCSCRYEKLNCDRGAFGYYYLTVLQHFKIKIRDKTFIAKIVDLSFNRLTNLTKDEILPGREAKVEELDLYYNSIEYIEDGAFDKFTSLKKLGLKLNSLKSMNATILTKQLGTTLEELDLSGNDLQNLSTNVFHHLSKLSLLNLNSNHNINLVSKINGINVTIFPEALSNLKKLYLKNCNFKHLDENVFINLKNLEALDISNNPFLTVPKAIRSLSNLRYLDLGTSKIVSILDCNFCNLPNLKTLNLAESFSLTYMDENAFGALNNDTTVPQIDQFFISFCNISVLPEKLLNWKNASRIFMQNNPLACNCSMAWLINDFNATTPLIVDKFRNELYDLDKNQFKCHSPSTLKGTHLHTLGGGFCKNETVLNKKDVEDVYYVCGENDDMELYKGCSCWDRSLECSYSPVSLPEQKLNHTNIQILKNNFTVEYALLSRNNITSLEKGKVLPGNEHSIRFLVLNANNITHIENAAFEKFKILYGLDLGGNNLTNVDKIIFPSTLQKMLLTKTNLDHIPTNDLSNLTLLDLSENPKIFVSSNIIFPKSLSNLTVLDIRLCNITTLNENVFVNLPYLEKLMLSQNPFSTIPTAINTLQNLQNLYLDFLNITVLKKNDFKILKNLELFSAQQSKLEKIDDCAFCNFPNLKHLDLDYNFKLSYIHENAFGSLTNEKPIQLETFSMEFGNVPTLSEKLLDWKNVSIIDLKFNSFDCNCSMAWLINDFNASKPLYVDNLRMPWGSKQSNKEELYCINPIELEYQYLHKLSGDFCLNETVTVEEEKVYHVCGGENGDVESHSVCQCEIQSLYCNLNYSINIEIISNITIKEIHIGFGNISHLSLKNLLPKKQHLIETLYFYYNHITSIENGTFDNFTSLKNLDLSDNNLSIIDENVFTEKLGSTLIKLDLGYNPLILLSSKTFFYLTKLKFLYLSGIPHIHKSEIFSSSLASLRKLDLSECNITFLSENVFVNLRNLTFLKISNNPLTTFPTAINLLQNLHSLDISFTDITVLNKNNIKLNTNLQYLYAHSSKIQRIEECAFCNFRDLRHVNLDHNRNLSFIHENAFGYAHSHIKPSMFTLNVIGCNLTAVPENLLNWTTADIEAYKNPLTCDCSMKWLVKLVKSNYSSFHQSHYQCHSPTEFEGKTFDKLSDSFCNESTTTTTTSTHPSTTTSSKNTVTDASVNSSYQQLIISILSIFIVISMVTVVAGVYYYRSRRVIQIQRNEKEGEEDLLEEDFDVENV